MTATNPENQRGAGAGRRPSNQSAQGQKQGSQHHNHAEAREHHLDQTIADSFPASDPPSTDPNPDGDD